MRGLRVYLLVGLLAVPAATTSHAQSITDAIYNSHHPRLLVTAAELPALHNKLADGGLDDATYASARQVVQNTYPHITNSDMLGPWFGEQSIPCIGLVGQLENDAAT